MGSWEILGISPDSDSRAVRRAYAQRAKSCHPEEDPEGFQQLYEAYQQALRYVRWRERQMNAPPDQDGPASSVENTPSDSPEKTIVIRPQSAPDAPSAMEVLPYLDQVLQQKRSEAQDIHQIRLAEMQALPNDSKTWSAYLDGEDFQLVMYDLDFMAGLAELLEEEAIPEAGCEELYYIYDLYQLENDIRWQRDFRGELYRLLRPVYRRRIELRRLQATMLERNKTKMQWLWEKLGAAVIGIIAILLALGLCWLVGEIVY